MIIGSGPRAAGCDVARREDFDAKGRCLRRHSNATDRWTALLDLRICEYARLEEPKSAERLVPEDFKITDSAMGSH